MIYTCTLNPSIDYLVQVDHVELGSLNRAKDVSFYPGGKGINVSRVLKNLGVESTALGYLGGFTGEFVRSELSKEGIAHDFIELSQPTRINIKLKTKVETEINGVGSPISEKEQEELLNRFNALTSNDYVVLAGSLPSSVQANFYERLALHCQKEYISFVVDTSGESLKSLLKYKPFLVKPNHHELGELFNKKVTSVEEVITAGSELLSKGPKNVIVSMGSAGAIFLNEEIIAIATVPKGDVVSTVGSGDSTVAGFLAEYVKSRNYLEAFKKGVASGTATAFSEDLCTKSKVEDILPKVKIEVVDRRITS